MIRRPRRRSHYWDYNLPLQIWPVGKDPEGTGKELKDYRILNYMPRKETCTHLNMSDLLEEGETREEFLENAALILENLAKLFRKAKNDPNMTIYYPDEGMNGDKDDE